MTSSVPARVLLLADCTRKLSRSLMEELGAWLEARVPSVRWVEDPQAWERDRLDGLDPEPAPELLVVIGGDGALLGAVRTFADDPPPTVGIHAGRVGFLASTTASRWQETLEAVLTGQCLLEQRMRIQAEWSHNGEPQRVVALNDVVLQRGTRQGMLTVRLSVGEQWVNDYSADGLIVATPSGSTAYSLSAGGPILEPNVSGIVVTPLSSQGLSTRPIVLGGNSELSLRVLSASGDATLSVDGQAFHRIAVGNQLSIRRHPVPYPLYAMPGLDPYRRLRSRLGWGSGLEQEPPV